MTIALSLENEKKYLLYLKRRYGMQRARDFSKGKEKSKVDALLSVATALKIPFYRFSFLKIYL